MEIVSKSVAANRMKYKFLAITCFACAVAFAAASAETPDVQPPRTKILNGRLEEIGGKGATLPVGISMPGLAQQQPKLDPRGMSAKTGIVSSFPLEWKGSWGGHIRVYNAENVSTDPLILEQHRLFSRPANGITFFHFQKLNKNRVILEPPEIFFPPMGAVLHNAVMPSTFVDAHPELRYIPDAVQAPAIPSLYLSAHDSATADGQRFNTVIVKNEIRQIKEGVFEQDIVGLSRHADGTAGSYVETVIRISPYRPGQIYVQSASVRYGPRGQFQDKLMLYGVLQKGWAPEYAEATRQRDSSGHCSLGYQGLRDMFTVLDGQGK